MCGIAGSVFAATSAEHAATALNALLGRGPDGHAILQNGNVTLIHARLSVIDLSAHAAQPMASQCGRYWIVFNGEIYNYRELRRKIATDYIFHSKSDTEVVLAYYARFGADALSDLRGMFAFAIWDKLEQSLFVARDRLGVKPLYFASIGQCFAFASRPTALHALLPQLDRTIDTQALRYFLEAGYVPAPHSIFVGMKKLQPGHFLRVTRTGVATTQYWSADHIKVNDALREADEQTLLDELDALLDESIQLRMVSDVPLGAFLSGGIDSSLVAAYMMKHASAPIETFTIGFSEKAFDESTHAAAVARHLGTKHTCEVLAVDQLAELMPTFVAQYDEPFFDYSAFPVMAVSRLARRSVTVSLSGDGGDEAFGGYHYYELMRRLGQIHRLPLALRSVLAATLQHLPGQRLRWLGHVIGADGPAPAYAFMRGVIKDASALMQADLLARTRPLAHLFAQRAENFPAGLQYAEIGMRLDLAYTLPDDYLQKVDVGSMAFSLEAREPLLDHKLIEWAGRLPVQWKMRGGTNKYLLKQLAYRYIPRAILDRPKMGFGVPMAQWLRGGLKAWAESLLADTASFEALELNRPAVLALWQAHQANRVQAHTALWSVLVVLQYYRSQFNQS